MIKYEIKIRKPELRNIVSESALADSIPGDWMKTKISASDEVKPRWMVYEGVISDLDSFMEKREIRILSWRSGRRYLQFSDTLPENRGIGVVIFSDLFREGPFEYNFLKDGFLYVSKMKLIVNANLCIPSLQEKYMLFQLALKDKDFLEAKKFAEEKNEVLQTMITSDERKRLQEGIEKGLEKEK
ncbi:hypothetical protein HYW75_01265 [Candidatus Pacearchaeota archaeon]|nr:hypothetical protein [Candidatus Pacearchaeota archaeon]